MWFQPTFCIAISTYHASISKPTTTNNGRGGSEEGQVTGYEQKEEKGRRENKSEEHKTLTMSDDSKDKGQNIKVCACVCLRVCACACVQVYIAFVMCVLLQVVLRCRPMTQVEASKEKAAIKCVSDKHVEVNYGALGKASKKSFVFDGVYDEKSTQKEVYESVVQPVVDEVLQGYNCTVFAYGQTGTGKTHTMEGDVSNKTHGVMQPNAGVIPRAVTQVL